MGDSQITVSTEYGDVIVHKIALAEYAKVLQALDKVPESLQSFFKEYDDDKLKKMSSGEYIVLLPALLAQSWADLVAVIAIPTDKDAKFIGKLDLADGVDIVGAILELNDIPRIIAAVKKMLALQAKISKPQKQT